MKISIIIVNYNVRYFLEQALLSVQKAIQNIPAEVFVVDNDSKDDSVVVVREKFPNVHLISNLDNPGFAKANNQAIRLAKGEYILLLNPDTVIAEDSLEKCLHFMDAHQKTGALGVRMIDGSGTFLPESKRGLPTPVVAFYKMMGLSKIFPKSPVFNRYHLGFLDEFQTHEVEVLAGAFMLLRKSALDKVGLLDETFFMYGEDIDLSYRITLGGYSNCYFADTTILHYKGESTKKGSLNYVKVFYQAMIIFAQKHFRGEQKVLFTGLLQLAVYGKAMLTVLSNFLKKIYIPLFDATLIFMGMNWLKNFWATAWFNNPDYYLPSFLYFNVPLYTSVWLGSVYFNGGYDEVGNIRKLIKGLITGSILLAAIYGLLPLSYRTSRMLLLLGAIWALVSLFLFRTILHFFKYRNLKVGQSPEKNFVIVGQQAEANRGLDLLNKSNTFQNFIGTVSPYISNKTDHIGDLSNLPELISVYRINEIIFCSKDVPFKTILHWMSKLGKKITYKIIPESSMSIIGSNSKNEPGELYTMDVRYRIDDAVQRRSKRLLDVALGIILLLFSPIAVFFILEKLAFYQNIFGVFFAQKTWVGYSKGVLSLPPIKKGILSPQDAFRDTQLDAFTIQRLNFFYARDYDWTRDIEIIWRGFRNLGNAE